MREHPWAPPSGEAPAGSRSLWFAALGAALVVSLAFAGYQLVTRTQAGPEPAAGGAVEEQPLDSGAGGARLDPGDIVDVIPMDGIPAIDEPVFQSVSEADWLADQEPVIAFELGGDARAYPLLILTWHEIVNDEVGGTPVAVTYCPLCNSPVVWERPVVEGEVTTFGTSGKLYQSNLVMYDRASESYWPQLTGQAVTGPLPRHRVRPALRHEPLPGVRPDRGAVPVPGGGRSEASAGGTGHRDHGRRRSRGLPLPASPRRIRRGDGGGGGGGR